MTLRNGREFLRGFWVALLLAAPGLARGQFEGSGPVQGDQGRPPTITEQGATPNYPASLKQTLQVGLKARRPQEFAFINRVVERVDDGELSDVLVKQAFNWARKKRVYRVQYFEFALKFLVERDGGRLF